MNYFNGPCSIAILVYQRVTRISMVLYPLIALTAGTAPESMQKRRKKPLCAGMDKILPKMAVVGWSPWSVCMWSITFQLLCASSSIDNNGMMYHNVLWSIMMYSLWWIVMHYDVYDVFRCIMMYYDVLWCILM